MRVSSRVTILLCLLSDLYFEWIPFEPRWNFVHFDDASCHHHTWKGQWLPICSSFTQVVRIYNRLTHTHRPSSSYSVNEDEGVVCVLLCRGLSTTKRKGGGYSFCASVCWLKSCYIRRSHIYTQHNVTEFSCRVFEGWQPVGIEQKTTENLFLYQSQSRVYI